MRFTGFIGPSYTLQSVNADCQRCLNLYPELNETGTGKEREVASLVGTPGMKLLATLGAGPIRGEFTASNGTLYVVSGATLYSVSSLWVATSVGTLGTSAGPVSMADNGVQLFLVDGTNGYVVLLSGAVTTTTGFIQWNDSAATVQAAIRAASTYLSGVTCSGSLTTSGLTIAWGSMSSPTIVVTTSTLDQAPTVTNGAPSTLVWASNPSSGQFKINLTLATGAFVTVIDPNFPSGVGLGPTMVTYQDGYFIFNKPNTQQFFLSGLNAVTFSALDVGTAEGLADNIVGQISDQRNLYLMGTSSTEVFYDSGATFPFERVQGAFISIGCMSAYSIAGLQGAVYWLGKDKDGAGIVYSAKGYQPVRISTFALEKVLRDYFANISTARAWTYQQNGHGFYCLNIPGSGTTWVFDTTTNLWHERSSITNGAFTRHWADCHAFAYNTNVVGDYQNGNIYSLDPAYYSDNGTTIPRVRAAPHVTKELNRVAHSRFQLDMETGVGLDGAGQGTDPQGILQWSDDSGHSWSNEHWASIGKIGTTKTRLIWRRLGMARDRVYRVTITDPVKVTLLGADVLAEEEAS